MACLDEGGDIYAIVHPSDFDCLSTFVHTVFLPSASASGTSVVSCWTSRTGLMPSREASHLSNYPSMTSVLLGATLSWKRSYGLSWSMKISRSESSRLDACGQHSRSGGKKDSNPCSSRECDDQVGAWNGSFDLGVPP